MTAICCRVSWQAYPWMFDDRAPARSFTSGQSPAVICNVTLSWYYQWLFTRNWQAAAGWCEGWLFRPDEILLLQDSALVIHYFAVHELSARHFSLQHMNTPEEIFHGYTFTEGWSLPKLSICFNGHTDKALGTVHPVDMCPTTARTIWSDSQGRWIILCNRLSRLHTCNQPCDHRSRSQSGSGRTFSCELLIIRVAMGSACWRMNKWP